MAVEICESGGRQDVIAGTEHHGTKIYDSGMSNSYVSNRLHIIFGTKYRLRALTPALRERLFPYLIATARSFGIEVLSIGGVEDHVHLLIALPPTISLSDAMKKVKSNTSRWIRETFGLKKFAWQEGYGAFGVSVNAMDATKEYIATQEVHHRRRDFRSEVEHILRQHGLNHDKIEWFQEP
jgi:REP element-mobilizing transposase RayT